MQIIGRNPEQRVLRAVLERDAPQFVAVYGRRRVGKTFLVREFFRDKLPMMEVTGKLRGDRSQQLRSFVDALEEQFQPAVDLSALNSWHDAFAALTSAVKLRACPLVLFLDELPWLAGRGSELLSEIDYYWNRHWSQLPGFKLVVCGSATHWVLDNIVRARGGLHNRLTAMLHLMPLSLQETEAYLESKDVALSRTDLLDLYLCIGGVPYYLDWVEPGKSVPETIQSLCFAPAGRLRQEYETLLGSLFRRHAVHKSILRCLAAKRYGLGAKAISDATGISLGGTLTKRLSELEACGLIKRYVPYGRRHRDAYYRVIDEFVLFHKKWLEDLSGQVATDTDHWLKISSSTQFSSWAGYNFETVVHKHAHCVLEALGIRGVRSTISHWQANAPAGLDDRHRRFQIDLVIDRADRVINLCEVKYSTNPYVVRPELVDRMRLRAAIFKELTGTKKTLHNVLICSSEIASKVTDSSIAAVVTTDALFR